MEQQDKTYRLDMGDLYGELAGHANLIESAENEHLERSLKTNQKSNGQLVCAM